MPPPPCNLWATREDPSSARLCTKWKRSAEDDRPLCFLSSIKKIIRRLIIRLKKNVNREQREQGRFLRYLRYKIVLCSDLSTIRTLELNLQRLLIVTYIHPGVTVFSRYKQFWKSASSDITRWDVKLNVCWIDQSTSLPSGLQQKLLISPSHI